MRKKLIKTGNYIYSIRLYEQEDISCFEIKAFCNISKTRSYITNLNFIISEIISPIIQIEDYETTIDVNKKQGIDLYTEAISAFNDINWLFYLEKALEYDKDAGKWAKI